MGGVCLWEVSAYGRCLLLGGVCLWEVSAYGGLENREIAGNTVWCPLAKVI